MTGTRFAAASITTSMTWMCSCMVSVGDSPVVPTGTSPSTPAAICSSTRRRSASSSSRSPPERRHERGDDPFEHRPFLYHTTPAIPRPRPRCIIPSCLDLALDYWWWDLFAVGQGGCGAVGPATAGDASTGGDGPAGIDGRITVDGPPAIDSATTGGFVTADVDGVTVRVETDFRSGTGGLAAGQIWITAGHDGDATRGTSGLTNSVGTSTCPPDWVALFEDPGRWRHPALRAAAAAAVTVTAAAPALGDVIEGTFTATLKTMPPSDSANRRRDQRGVPRHAELPVATAARSG